MERSPEGKRELSGAGKQGQSVRHRGAWSREGRDPCARALQASLPADPVPPLPRWLRPCVPE